MSTIDLDADAVTVSEEIPEENPIQAMTDAAYAMSAEDFNTLKAADKMLTLFLLLRDQAAEIRALGFKVGEYEEKAKELATPEGLQRAMASFMGASNGKGSAGMGQLLASLVR